MRQYRLFRLRLRNSILPLEAVGWPRWLVLPMQQHDVEVVRLCHSTQLVGLLLRIHSRMGRNLGQKPITIPRHAFEGYAQHLGHSVVRLGRLEEAHTTL